MYGPEFKLSEETIELREYIGKCITIDREVIGSRIGKLIDSNKYFHIDKMGLVRFYKPTLYNDIADLTKYDNISPFKRELIIKAISSFERREIEPYYEVLVGNKSFKNADPEGLCMFYEVVEEDLYEVIYPNLDKRLGEYIYDLFDRLSEFIHVSAFITEDENKVDRAILIEMYPDGYLDLKHI